MKKDNYKAKVNGQFEFDIKQDDQSKFDLVVDGTVLHVLWNKKSYRAEVINANPNTKSFEIKINGNTYHIELEDQYDQLADQLGLSVVSTQQINDIKAPMPGLVLDINIETGQNVQKGDGLLVLEAMKMENIIKSPGDGIVKTIHVIKGTAVDKGQILIEME